MREYTAYIPYDCLHTVKTTILVQAAADSSTEEDVQLLIVERIRRLEMQDCPNCRAGYLEESQAIYEI